MSNETDTFVQEVNEGLREERLLAIAKRYGPYFLVAFVVVVAALVGGQAWRDNQREAGRRHAETFIAAQQLASGDNKAAAAAEFERLSTQGPPVYRVMARMEWGAMLEAQGDLEAALAAFDAAAAASNDPIMRDTAQLRAAYLAAETEDFAALRQRLEPLAASNSRLAFLARELLGVEAWEAGEIDLARETLQALTLAFDAPDAVRGRAQLALSVIGPAPETPADGAHAPAPSEGESK